MAPRLIELGVGRGVDVGRVEIGDLGRLLRVAYVEDAQARVPHRRHHKCRVGRVVHVVVMHGLVFVRVHLTLAVLRLVDGQAELGDGLRVRRVLDVGEPRLCRSCERRALLRDAAVRRAEDAFVGVQEVRDTTDGRGPDRVAASAELADDARRAARRAVGFALEPPADVDDGELLAVHLLAADVEGLVVVGRPRLMGAARLWVHLVVHRRRNLAFVVTCRPRGHIKSRQRLLDVAEVLHAGVRVGVEETRDVDCLHRDGCEDVAPVARQGQVVDVLRPVVRRFRRVVRELRVRDVPELAAVTVGDVVDVHRLRVAHCVVAVLPDDEDRPAAGRGHGVDRLGGRERAGVAHRRDVRRRAGGRDTDNGDAGARRRVGLALRRDRNTG